MCHVVVLDQKRAGRMPFDRRGEELGASRRGRRSHSGNRQPGSRQKARICRVICFVLLSSGSTLMETFGAWDRSQKQKWPPGIIECPPYA